MSANYERIDKHPKASWLRLPAWVRGYGDEILRHCDTTGLVCDSAEAEDVALVIRAQDDELEMLSQAIGRLIEQGFLTRTDAGLVVTNYKTMRQRKMAAERKRKSRDDGDDVTKRDTDAQVTLGHGASRPVTPVTETENEQKTGENVTKSRTVTPCHASHETSHRGEERRGEDYPPTPRPGGSGRSGKIPCPADLTLTEDQRASLSVELMCDVSVVRRGEARFVADWVGSSENPRSLEQWRRSMAKAIRGYYHDPEIGPELRGQRKQRDETSEIGAQFV